MSPARATYLFVLMLMLYITGVIGYNLSMKYSLGLDIGTTSIGWAVIDLDNERIHDLGVRIFEGAEHPKNGDPLAKPRRDARGTRRRLKRRRQRLNHLKQFFINYNILTKQQVEAILDPASEYNKLDTYDLRDKATHDALSSVELFKVLYQISKRRGFKSNRKVVEESDKQGEGGAVTQALKANELFLKTKGYKTVGVALNQDDTYKVRKRNSNGTYTNSFARADFIHELEMIVEQQKQYALKDVSDQALQELIYGIDSDGATTNQSAIMYQRPFMTEELIKKMVGQCTFEDNEKRAPRASYSFELFRLASDLSHLVYIPKGSKKREAPKDKTSLTLSPEQINAVIAEAKKGGTLTYIKVRKAAGISDDYAPDPRHVRGQITKDDPYGEENDFGNFKAYHAIRLALKNFPVDWAKIDNEATLNEIAYTLTVQKSDEGIRDKLQSIPISDEAKEAILKIKPTHFKAFGHLSIKALQKITKHIIESGLTYDKACEAADYDFRKKAANLEEITNPVVKRAITQTNKVVKAIIRKYGAPCTINVETARDLAKNRKDRDAITAENKENQAYNDDIKLIIELGYDTTPKTKGGQQLMAFLHEHNVPLHKNADFNGKQITKIKLYREQNGRCLYSGKEIDWGIMLHDDNAYQIDHIVPFSRSNNDGLTNKILVHTEENQKKADRTPYEYFGSDEARWKQYVANVESIYKTRDVKTDDKLANKLNYKYNGYALKKKQNLLLTDYKNDSWGISHLQNTRYITRFIRKYLEQTVDFAPRDEADGVKKVFTPNGTITSYLRKRWGLSKIREEDVLHHAADAAIVGAIDDKVIYRANIYAKKQEVTRFLANAKTMREKTDLVTGEITDEDAFNKAQQENMAHQVLSDKHFPQPWKRKDFAKEVRKRTLNTDVATIQNELRGLENYDEEFRLSVKPIFVSRMPNRKVTSKAHKETVRSPKIKDGDQRTVRMSLLSAKEKDVRNSVLAESDRWLYNKLLERLRDHDDKPEKAFAEPIYKNDKKFDKNGKPLAPVSTIKVYSTQPDTSGFSVNNDRAWVNNGSMVRLDVYQKVNPKGKIEHFFVPIYTHHIPKEKRGLAITKILPEPTGFTDVDSSFTKITSLYPNDYVRFYFANKVEEGYYKGYNIANGQMDLLSHADANQDNVLRKNKRSAISIERLDISVLGDNYKRI